MSASALVRGGKAWFFGAVAGLVFGGLGLALLIGPSYLGTPKTTAKEAALRFLVTVRGAVRMAKTHHLPVEITIRARSLVVTQVGAQGVRGTAPTTVRLSRRIPRGATIHPLMTLVLDDRGKPQLGGVTFVVDSNGRAVRVRVTKTGYAYAMAMWNTYGGYGSSS
ncbi:MAG: hypothetical protein ACYDEV_18210 [Acidiferrobacter sp.]